MKEKRKFLRVKDHCLAKYKVEGSGTTLTFVRNISVGGMKFHAKEAFKLGADVDMYINFPPYPKPIDVVVKIVWCKPMKDFDGFDVGAEFVWINEDARDFIEQKIRETAE